MIVTYSTYDAKAKFSEILRRVRTGQRVLISYRGEAVAEIRRVETPDDAASKLRLAEERGVISGPRERRGQLRQLAKRPGGLGRFLESRD